MYLCISQLIKFIPTIILRLLSTFLSIANTVNTILCRLWLWGLAIHILLFIVTIIIIAICSKVSLITQEEIVCIKIKLIALDSAAKF